MREYEFITNTGTVCPKALYNTQFKENNESWLLDPSIAETSPTIDLIYRLWMSIAHDTNDLPNDCPEKFGSLDFDIAYKNLSVVPDFAQTGNRFTMYAQFWDRNTPKVFDHSLMYDHLLDSAAKPAELVYGAGYIDEIFDLDLST